MNRTLFNLYKKYKNTLRRILYLIVALLSVLYLLSNNNLIIKFFNGNKSDLILAVLFGTLGFLFHVHLFYHTLKCTTVTITFFECIKIASYTYILNFILPAKAGLFYLGTYLKKNKKIDLPTLTSSIIFLNLYQLFAAIICSCLIVLALKNTFSIYHRTMALVCMLFITLGIYILQFRPSRFFANIKIYKYIKPLIPALSIFLTLKNVAILFLISLSRMICFAATLFYCFKIGSNYVGSPHLILLVQGLTIITNAISIVPGNLLFKELIIGFLHDLTNTSFNDSIDSSIYHRFILFSIVLVFASIFVVRDWSVNSQRSKNEHK